MTTPGNGRQAPPAGRLGMGAAVFVGGQLAPVILIPLVANSDLSAEWKTGLSGVLLLGVPELCILAAVAILGRSGFDYLKARIFGLFKRLAPAATVSPARYRIGLVLFCTPLVFGFVQPYFGDLISDHENSRLVYSIAGDAMLVVSLFVLGGDFWDKLRALFNHRATAQIPARRS